MRSSPDQTVSGTETLTRLTAGRRYPPTFTRWMLVAAVLLAMLCALGSPLNGALWDALNRSLPAPPTRASS